MGGWFLKKFLTQVLRKVLYEAEVGDCFGLVRLPWLGCGNRKVSDFLEGLEVGLGVFKASELEADTPGSGFQS